MNETIYQQAKSVTQELCERAKLKKGDIIAVGCSSSEVAGGVIGHDSSMETAQAVFQGIYEVLSERGIFLAAQCCEHLNRAIIIEREACRTQRLSASFRSRRQAVRLRLRFTAASMILSPRRRSARTPDWISAAH